MIAAKRGGGEPEDDVAPPGPAAAAPRSDGSPSPIASEAGVLRFPQIRKTRWRPRVVWVRGDGGGPEPRVVRVGITDGSYSEVREGDLKEGEPVITGSNLAAESPSRPNNPFGGPFGSRPTVKSGGGRRP